MGKDFIQKGIKKPGALAKKLGMPKKDDIPIPTLKTVAKKCGKLDMRARFALVLEKIAGKIKKK